MKKLIFLLLITVSFKSMASKEYTVEEYIDKYKHIAIVEMEKSGIPASITLAQGIIESRFGNSRLATNGNNHFGIKCHKGWTGKKMYHDDDERNECFRVYRNAEQSYEDHTEFLQTRSRYSFLFDYASTDYKNWAHGLKKAGYATNPKYASILINLIEKYQLYLYDRSARHQIAANKHEDRNSSTTKQVASNKDYKVNNPKIYTSDIGSPVSKEVFSFNRIKAVKVGEFDNLQSIAQRHSIPQNRLMNYNDIVPGETLEKGQFIYLQPKRGKAVHREHIVQNGETLKEISQLHGVKLAKLYKRNLLSFGEEPAAGQTIYLNKKADKKPVVLSKEAKEKQNQKLKKEKEEEAVALQEVFERTEAAMKKAEEEAKRKQAEKQAEVDRLAEETRQKALEHQKDVDNKLEDKDASNLEPVAVPRDLENKSTLDEKVIEDVSKSTEKASTFITHKVVKGDTLYNLSKRYGVSISDLKKWNKLSSNTISLGQELQVKK